jgi:TPR repeat protein
VPAFGSDRFALSSGSKDRSPNGRADQGQALAQFNLGLMYANGMGPQDYVQAHMRLSLAAARGAQEALKNREIVERHMTTAQIADARELARDWKPKPIQ